MEPMIQQLEKIATTCLSAEDANEISRKRFEKGLLVRYQTGIELLQERKLQEGVQILHEILSTDELIKQVVKNSDYEKLKAACFLNLYSAYWELKEKRKSFYFAIKYLDYEQDNYQLSFEFGTKLLIEGYLTGSLVYLKRALSFSIARNEEEFSQLIMDKLVLALCMTDHPENLKGLLTGLETQKVFKNISLNEYWNKFYAFLTILNSQEIYDGKYSQELKLVHEESKKDLTTDILQIKKLRNMVIIKNQEINVESIQLALSKTVPRKIESTFEHAMFKINTKNVTLNGILAKIIRQIDEYKKPKNKIQNYQETIAEKKRDNFEPNKTFFNQILNDVIFFENDKKTTKENNNNGVLKSYNLIYDAISQQYGIQNDEMYKYLLDLLSETGIDIRQLFLEESKNEMPKINNFLWRNFSSFKAKFYQTLLEECSNQTIIKCILIFLDNNFKEKKRDFISTEITYFFYGPSIFLKDDFQINCKEFFNLFSFLVSYFPSFIDFGVFLIFLECYFNSALIGDLKTNHANIQKFTSLLKSSFYKLNEKYFEDETIAYFEFLTSNRKKKFIFSDILTQNHKNKNCEITNCVNLCSGENDWKVCNNCLGHILSKDFKNTSTFRLLTLKIKEGLRFRTDHLFEKAHFEEINAISLKNEQQMENGILIRSNLLPIHQYWLKQEKIEITLENYEKFFVTLISQFTLNDLQFLETVIKLDFHKIYEELEQSSQFWMVLTEFVSFFILFTIFQTASDQRIFHDLFDLSMSFFQLKEISQYVYNRLHNSESQIALKIKNDIEFQMQTTKLIIFLFNCEKTSSSNILFFLIKIKLSIFWKTDSFEQFIMFFQFLNTYNESLNTKFNLNESLLPITQKIRLLKSCIKLLENFPQNPNPKINVKTKFDLRIYLIEITRIFEFIFNVKTPINQCVTFFRNRVLEEEDFDPKNFLESSKNPLSKPKTSLIYTLDENSLSKKKFNQKLFVEMFLSFRLYSELNGGLTNLEDFFFCGKDTEPRFGENKYFIDKALRVYSFNDFWILQSHFSKIEKIFKSVENESDFLEIYSIVLSNNKLRKIIMDCSLSETENNLKNINYNINTHLYKFLLLLVRFQESLYSGSHIKVNEESKLPDYNLIHKMYVHLQSKNPFLELKLKIFLNEAVSRTAFISDSLSNSYSTIAFQTECSSNYPEIEENNIIHAIINYQRAIGEADLLFHFDCQFPNLVSSKLIEYLKLNQIDYLNFLKDKREFIQNTSTKRIDYLLIFYFPELFLEICDYKIDIVLKRVEVLMEALNQSTLESYHLNFKSSIDVKTSEKTNPIRILAIARIISSFYNQINKSHRMTNEIILSHLNEFENDSQSIIEVNIENWLKEHKKSMNKSQNGDSEKNEKLLMNEMMNKNSRDEDSIEIVEMKHQKSDNKMIIEHNNQPIIEAMSTIGPLYQELSKFMEKKPKGFKEIWLNIFQIISEFNPKDRKNLSSLFYYFFLEIMLQMTFIFKKMFVEYQPPQNIIEAFKKIEGFCREKDFKIHHVDFSSMRNCVLYQNLKITEPNGVIHMSFLFSSIRQLKKIETKPGDFFSLYLLLPLIMEISNGDILKNIELVRLIWDSRIEIAKNMHSHPMVEHAYKCLSGNVFELIVNHVKTKIPTLEEQREMASVIESPGRFLSENFDIEMLLKNNKCLKSNIKKYFEDKHINGCEVKPIPVVIGNELISRLDDKF